MNFKTCSKCKLDLSMDLFDKDKSHKDGLCSCCKACRKIKNRIIYIVSNPENCVCKICLIEKPKSEFLKGNGNNKGLRTQHCRKCTIKKIEELRKKCPYERKCKKCEQLKTLDDFYKSLSYDGYDKKCKQCYGVKYKNQPICDIGFRFCRKCKLIRKNSFFNYCKKSKDKISHYCKDCSRRPSREYNRKSTLDKFNLSETNYNEILSLQDYKCAICKTDTPGGNGAWHIDHCHNSGKVRGLLCSTCNVGLGMFKDNPEFLSIAIKYLNQ